MMIRVRTTEAEELMKPSPHQKEPDPWFTWIRDESSEFCQIWVQMFGIRLTTESRD